MQHLRDATPTGWPCLLWLADLAVRGQALPSARTLSHVTRQYRVWISIEKETSWVERHVVAPISSPSFADQKFVRPTSDESVQLFIFVGTWSELHRTGSCALITASRLLSIRT